jgi:flagellar hook-associated protein 2
VVINIGGLATGLDTNAIVDQLVAVERRRGVGLLQDQKLRAEARNVALQTFNGKVLALLTAVDRLRDAATVVARTATSSSTDRVTASASAAAAPGTTTITVTQLARGAIATSATGTASPDGTIASGSGTFAFQVGSGAVQSIAVDTTTTLAELASAINDLDAGASASVVNVGTTGAPDYRLRLAGAGTGTSNGLTIITDDTTLGVAVTQGAQNASFTVSGFVDPLVRESNTFDDVIPGVTLTLHATGGPTDVTVASDVEATTTLVQDVVTAFNDVINFVASESNVTQDTESEDRAIQAGPLAFDRTVRTVLETLRGKLSDPVAGLGGALTLLAQVGIDTQRDGTLAFDAEELQAALASGEGAVAALFGGGGGVEGVADRLHDFLGGVTQAGGLIAIGTSTVTERIASLEERIAAGERNLDAFEANLRATFVSLEVLVGSLQTQGSFLDSFFGRGGQTR